ncbi:MAG: alpha/beta hydrolase [Firmicutes bacterium]|nr:alpha/beta hydrolase [Bacillota bacterium]
MADGYIRSGSADIHYEIYEKKEAPVLVLIHGNGGKAGDFKHQVEFFKDRYTLLVPDSRGHGQSSFGRDDLSLGKIVIDLENILKTLEYDKVNILGFSDGANIAMLFAIKNPDMVDRLILVGGNYKFSGLTFSAGALIYLGYISHCLAAKFSSAAKLEKEVYALMVNEPKLERQALTNIKAKTLVVNGKKDMIKVSHAKDIASAIPNATLSLNEGDHFYLFKEHEEFNKRVLAFLEEE